MRPSRLQIKNVGILKDIDIPLDNKDAVIFTGEVRQGKTTILNAIKFLFGKSYPKDLIRHGAKDAVIQIDFDNGRTIKKEFYIGRDGAIKNRSIEYRDENQELIDKPFDKIQQIISPFTLDQDYLVNMTALERRKYFLEVFEVETNVFDKEIKVIDGELKDKRATLKAIPEETLEEVVIIDQEPIRNAIGVIEAGNQAIMVAHYQKDAEERARVTQENAERESKKQLLADAAADTIRLEREIESARERLEKSKKIVADNSAIIGEAPTEYVSLPEPTLAPTGSLKEELEAAVGSGYARKEYERKLAEQARRGEIQAEIDTLSAKKRGAVSSRFQKLQAVNEKHGIQSLVFTDDGSFTFEDTSADMLSTSQLMRLSSLMDSKYPDAIKVETVDRAESLGSSVIDYISRAAVEKKLILMSIVGEYPADSDDKVGVFVVKDGELS